MGVEMKLIVRPRNSGKTKTIILKSSANNIPIVCANQIEVDRILATAKNMGIHIPCPISAHTASKLLGRSDACYVDNADWILEQFLHARVVEATVTEDTDIDNVKINRSGRISWQLD
jgi:hypothetical protein